MSIDFQSKQNNRSLQTCLIQFEQIPSKNLLGINISLLFIKFQQIDTNVTQKEKPEQKVIKLKNAIKALEVFCCLTKCSYAVQSATTSDGEELKVEAKWSLLSQLYHRWFKDLIQQKFSTQCTINKELNVLYDCNTSVAKYKEFWLAFIEGLFVIKFKEEDDIVNNKETLKTLVKLSESTLKWILITKVEPQIEIEELYEDIGEFPTNVFMNTLIFQDGNEDVVQYIKQIFDWDLDKINQLPSLKKKFTEKYLQFRQIRKTEDNEFKSDDEQAIDKSYFLKKYYGRQCIAELQRQYRQDQEVEGTKNCEIPVLRYCHYLRDLFLYYIDQPEQYVKRQKDSKSVLVDQKFLVKISKIWIDIESILVEYFDASCDQQSAEHKKQNKDSSLIFYSENVKPLKAQSDTEECIRTIPIDKAEENIQQLLKIIFQSLVQGGEEATTKNEESKGSASEANGDVEYQEL